MPSFGIIEAGERIMNPLAQELRDLLRGITEEQKRTNNLLGQLVAVQREQAKPTQSAPKTRGSKVSTS